MCNKLLNREITCAGCGNRFLLPWIWVAGIEVVVRCPKCRRPMKTGYKMGAVLMALALTAAIVTANLVVWVSGSWATIAGALLIIPMWIFLGFRARKWWLLRKSRRVEI